MPNPKNKEPETYSSVLKGIRDIAGKKKASALLPLFRTMTKYLHKADSELVEATIHLLPTIRIGKDDNKVSNLVHLFVSHLASSCTQEENAQYADLLAADLESPYFARVLSAFKAYCVALKYAGDNERLKSVVLRYAGEAQNGTSDMQRCLAELFCVLRYCNLDCAEIDSLIQWGFTTGDAAVLRHCLGMLLSLSEEAPQRVVPLLQPCLNDSNLIGIIASDNLAAICFIRLCYALYLVTKDGVYLRHICSYTNYEADSSMLLSLELLSQLPYETLSSLNKDGNPGSGELIQVIAEKAHARCVEFNTNNDTLGIIAICRIVINLGKALIPTFGSRDDIKGSPVLEATKVALDGLYNTLLPYSTSISIYVQTSVLKVMIWLVNPPQNEENRAEYLHLVRRTTAMQLPVAIAREILQQLANRALSTPSLSHFAVEVAWAWFVQNPMTVTVDTLAMSWHACFSLRDLKNIEYTMDFVFRLLDYVSPSEETYEHIANLKTVAYWFLGDCIDIFATIGSSVDCIKFYQPIIIRLQKAAVLGDWKMRREAIRSLGKIGLVSEDPIRISIYEILQNLTASVSSEESTVYNDLIEPILDVFDQIYEAIELEEPVAPIIDKQRMLFHQSVIH